MVDKIINAAMSCFARNGFHKTSIDDIARELQVSKGSIYYYFSNKSDIIYQVIEHSTKYLTSYLEKENAVDQPLSQMIHNVVNNFITVAITKPDAIPVMYNRATEGLDNELIQRINELHDSLTKLVAGHLEYGAKIGRVRETKDYEAMAAGIIALLSHMCLYNMRKEHMLSQEELTDLIVTMISEGILKEQK